MNQLDTHIYILLCVFIVLNYHYIHIQVILNNVRTDNYTHQLKYADMQNLPVSS